MRAAPTPDRRASGATHIDTISTTVDDASGRNPPTRPTTRSSTMPKNVARSRPRDPATARSTHSASVRPASRSNVELNADGASLSASRRTRRRSNPSRAVMRRINTPTQLPTAVHIHNEIPEAATALAGEPHGRRQATPRHLPDCDVTRPAFGDSRPHSNRGVATHPCGSFGVDTLPSPTDGWLQYVRRKMLWWHLPTVNRDGPEQNSASLGRWATARTIRILGSSGDGTVNPSG